MHMEFDVVVLGTGSAALAVAWRCRDAGWRVAVVDSRPFGGTCALRGCDPKKVLVGAAEAVAAARQLAGKGVEGAPRIEWPELMRFKRTFTEPVPKEREESFAKAGIAAFHGRARFVGPAAVRVGEQELRGRFVVIATGARPAPLGFPGEDLLATNEDFLELDELPRRIAFVGGGYISFEFAHLAARAGAQATILHRGARPLEQFEPDLVARLVEHSRSLGIDIRTGAAVHAVERGYRVRSAAGEVEADLVVHGAGRIADLDDLDLDKAGVQRTPRGVAVDEFMRSISNPAVYACGDAAAGGPKLTPVANADGRVVAANMIEGNHHRPNYAGTPSVVFTIPPLARAGLGEAEARDRGLKFRVNAADTSNWYSSRRIGETVSGYKILIEEPSQRILGAHLLGAEAAEVVNLFAVAIRRGITAPDLKETIFAYPTHSSDLSYML
jgi:glutathione reductase (NADPH)